MDGAHRAIDVLFHHPQQSHVPLVDALELTRQPTGHLLVGATDAQTSIAGIYAAGDLITPAQSAIGAAGSAMFAAAMINHDLCPLLHPVPR
jgi:thioredoxin reductase